MTMKEFAKKINNTTTGSMLTAEQMLILELLNRVENLENELIARERRAMDDESDKAYAAAVMKSLQEVK